MPLCFTSNFSAAQLGHKARTWCMEIWSFKVVMELMISEILLISDNAKKKCHSMISHRDAIFYLCLCALQPFYQQHD